MPRYSGTQDEQVAFIDFEASGLGARSWPVEVGWAFLAGEATSFLIRPSSDWPMSDWDPEAERLHGLGKPFLDENGRDPREVATMMNEALVARKVYSDAPDWDGFWLFRLFQAAGLKPAFRLLDYGALILPLLGVSKEQLFQRADELSPRNHRALNDAQNLRTLYQLAIGAIT